MGGGEEGKAVLCFRAGARKPKTSLASTITFSVVGLVGLTLRGYFKRCPGKANPSYGGHPKFKFLSMVRL